VQSAQAARWMSDFISAARFSTRFSTELLKTFTLRSHLNSFFLANWFGNCPAAGTFFACSRRISFSFSRFIPAARPCAMTFVSSVL
jgi:hypothetical protein